MDETQEEIDGINKEREESGDEAAKQLALKAGADLARVASQQPRRNAQERD